MPSVITDFALHAKLMHPEISLAPVSESVTNWNKANIYRRTITINNTGKLAKTNYVTRLVWDTRTLFTDYKTTPTMNDVRVYDTDGVTRLQHFIFAPISSYTTILILVPSISAGATKSIFIEYGNPALPNLASFSGVAPSAMVKSSKILECFSLDTYRNPNQPENSATVHYWNNRANQFNSPLNRNAFTANMPTMNTAVLSPVPVLAFTTNKTLFTWDQHNLRTRNTDGITMFTISYADTALSRYQRQLSFQDATGGFIISHWNNGGAGQNQFIVSNDGGTAGLNTGVVLGQWNLSCCRWSRNATNGMFTRRNGALVAQRNSTNVALVQPSEWNQFTIGSFNITTEYFDGFMACALIFDEALSVAECQDVEVFLNSIYQIYGTDFPTVTIGSESTISGGKHSYTSFAPFSSFNLYDKIDNIGSLSKQSAKATIKTMIEKTLVTGANYENWSLSTQVTNEVARQLTASTSNSIDSVTITRTQGVNINDLSQFFVDNLVGADNYASSANDYIEFKLTVENASLISLANSYIEFVNAGGTNAFRALLSANLNTMYSNRESLVKIKKSAFTVQAGSPTWSNVSDLLRVNIRTSSGTQLVKYKNFQLVKNWDEEQLVSAGSQVQLTCEVSSDLGSSYFAVNNQSGLISQQLNEDDQIVLSVDSYLANVTSKSFSDLPAFPSQSYLFPTNLGSSDFTDCYTRAMRHVLSLIFPNTYLDVDLNMKSGDHLIGGVASYNGAIAQSLAIKSSEKVGDVINNILKACGGVLSYDTVNQKITARNGYKTWDRTGGSLPTAYRIDRIIPPYKSDTSELDDSFNYLETTAIWGRQNRSVSYNPLAPAVGMYGDFALIRPTVGNERVTLFFDAVVNGAVDVVFHPQFYVDGWSVSDSQFGIGGNNTGVNIVDARIVGDQLALSFTNASGANRYLVAFGCGGDYIAYDYLTNYNSVFQTQFIATAENTTDSSAKGKKPYTIDPKYSFYKMNNGSGAIIQLPELYSNVVTQLNTEVYDVLEVDYDPNLRVGLYVIYEDKSGSDRNGFIVSIDTYIENTNYSQTLKIRRV